MVRKLKLDRALLVRVWACRGCWTAGGGGILDRRDAWRLGLWTKGSSQGTASSVRPSRAFGALASTGVLGTSLSKLILRPSRLPFP